MRANMYFVLRLVMLTLSLMPVLVYGDYSLNSDANAFIDDMVSKHQFDKNALLKAFAQAERKDAILEAIAKPAEKKLTWGGYRKIFMTEERIVQGRDFVKKYQPEFKRAEQTYGVPAHIIAAIIGVETRYGKQAGNYRVIDALSTLAFDYPPRAKFFKQELEQVLLLAREQGFDLLQLKGSYAGAMGYGQFIPSSYRNFAIDFDGDGVADILNNPIDAIGSVANYFAQHKWRAGEPVTFQTNVTGTGYQALLSDKLQPLLTLGKLQAEGVFVPSQYDLAQVAKLQPLEGENGQEFWVTLHNFDVITRYNHRHLYAMAVYQLSEAINLEIK